MRRSRIAVIAVLASSFALASAPADPVAVESRKDGTSSGSACAAWVAPEEEMFRWTWVCAAEADMDGDGAIEQRRAVIWWQVCEEEELQGGNVCWEAETIAEDDVTADEFSVDIEAGMAAIEAAIGDCVVSVSVDDALEMQTWDDPGAQQHGYTLDPPAASVWLRKRDARYAQRYATPQGTICPETGASDAPRHGVLFRRETVENSTTVRVDPLG